MKLRWPFLIWLGAVVVAAALYLHSGRTGSVVGVVQVAAEDIAPMETARLEAVFVTEGQQVRKGELLAQFDRSMLRAEMGIYQLQLDRQFEQAVTDARSALQEAERRYAEDRAELEVLDVEMERLDDLLGSRLIDAQAVVRIKTRQQALARSVEQYPETVEAMKEQLAATEDRNRSMRTWVGDVDAVEGRGSGAAASTDEAVGRHELGLLKMRYDSYVLRATRDGIISRIYKQTGEVVGPGEAVLRLIDDDGMRVVGYLPEWQAHEIAVGESAYVESATSPRGRTRVTVATVGPDIVALPGRVSPVRGESIRGRRITLSLDESSDLLPGESVAIFLHRPWLKSLKNRYVKGSSEAGGS